MIEWLRANMPFGQYEVTPHEQPLRIQIITLIWLVNHSVFTHLDERSRTCGSESFSA